jgi:hypothetical protein
VTSIDGATAHPAGLGAGARLPSSMQSPHKAAQPRSSEKNAASRAGQTPCTRWAVTIFLTKARKSVTAANRAFEEKQPLVFLPKAANSWIHGGVRPQERESGAGGGGGEREVKIRRH